MTTEAFRVKALNSYVHTTAINIIVNICVGKHLEEAIPCAAPAENQALVDVQHNRTNPW